MSDILIVGGDRGLGFSLVKASVKRLAKAGEKRGEGTVDRVIVTSRRTRDAVSDQLAALAKEVGSNLVIVPEIDLTNKECGKKVATALTAVKASLSLVVYSAGLFVEEPGKLDQLDWDAQIAMYAVCAIAPTFVLSELLKASLLPRGCCVGIITSEGGSMGLRTLREGGSHYGHHGSKAASNMIARLAAFDLHSAGVPVVALHPGFMRTDMTQHYSSAYEDLGALPADEVAPTILDLVAATTLDTTGRFVSAVSHEHVGCGVYALPHDQPYPAPFEPGQDLPY
jgi:NAD(P)-dependent dehydrogenase (short-subunit alcohol dehydrogenase family)